MNLKHLEIRKFKCPEWMNIPVNFSLSDKTFQCPQQAAIKEQQMQPAMMDSSAQFHSQMPGINKQEDPHSLDVPT